MISPKGIYPPEGGWIANTWYLVEVSCRSGNPVHLSIMCSGFLDEKGNPSSYHGVFPSNYAPDDGVSPVHSYRYLKVIKILLSDTEIEKHQKRFYKEQRERDALYLERSEK